MTPLIELLLVVAGIVAALGGTIFVVNANLLTGRNRPSNRPLVGPTGGDDRRRSGLPRRLHMYLPWIVGALGVVIFLLVRAVFPQ